MASMEAAQSSAPLQPQEVQLLAAIVASVMPILNRMQPGPPASQTGMPALGPRVEQEAAAALVQDITAACLRKLAAYLDQHAEQHRALESCIPLATRAAQCFASRDFATGFAAVWQAYQAITAARAADPGLPALAEAPAGFAQTH